jgi:hypothetical protein
MVNEILLYLGSLVVMFWGASHLFPTKDVVKEFGKLSRDNELILLMEWIAEGMTLVFIGLLVLVVTAFGGAQDKVSGIVYLMSIFGLLAFAVLKVFTGARTSILPFKMCPVILSTSALLLLLGMLV